MSENKNQDVSINADPNNFSRRKMLQIIFWAGAGIVGIGPRAAFSDNKNRRSANVPTPENKDDYFLELPEIAVGNLLLTPVMVEHGQSSWDKYGEKLSQSVDKFPIVIPEYFPYEYQRLMRNPIIGNFLSTYDDTNAVFSHLEKKLHESQKEIWVVDPSYSEASIVYRILANIPTALAIGMPSAKVADVVMKEMGSSIRKVFKIKKEEEAVVSRIYNMVKMYFDAAIYGGSLAMDGNQNEQESRRAFTAQAIVELGTIVKPGTKAVIIYPQAHWTDIQKFIEDPKSRTDAIQAYKLVFDGNPIFEDFFKMRHYTVEGNGWKQGVVTSSLKPSMRE